MHASLSMQINSPLYIGHKGAMVKQSKKVTTEGWLWPLRPAGRTSDTYVQCLTFAWAEVQHFIGIRLCLAFPPPLFCEKYCVFFAAFESFPSTCQHFDSLTDFLAVFLLQCHHALFSPYFLDLPLVSSDMCAETALCSSAIFHTPCTGFGDLLCKQQCKRLS